MNDIQEQIAKLHAAGYSNRDIYDTLVYLDKMDGEVVSSGMAAFFDQKYKEEKEKYEQQRAEMQKKHDAILGNGYDLKKKDSPSEDIPSESSGGAPETQADPLAFAMRTNDEKLLKQTADARVVQKLLSEVAGTPNPEAFAKAYEAFLDLGLTLDGYDEDYELRQEDMMDLMKKLRVIKAGKRSEMDKTVQKANELNKAAGYETTYELDERNPGSFYEAQKDAVMRIRRDEELLEQSLPEYVNEDFERYQEDLKEAYEDASEISSLGYLMHGLSNTYMDAFYSVQQTKANWWGDEEAVRQLRYHQEMQRQKRGMEKREMLDRHVKSEASRNLGVTEHIANYFGKAMRGQASLEDGVDFMARLAIEGTQVASDFAYYGAHIMAGPLGWASMFGQIASSKNADLLADRADLNSFERGALAVTAGIVETGAAVVFSGAEKAFSKGLRSLGTRQRILNAENYLRSGRSGVFDGVFASGLSEGFEEGFVQVMDYAAEAGLDKAMGRRADNPDIYEFTDAFILGMMGGKGGKLSGNLMTSMASYMGHNKNFVNRMAMENIIRETEAEYNAAPAASAEKANLRIKLLNLRSQLREMRSEEARAYDNFSLEDKQKIRNLDQQLARMRDMLRSKKDGAGIKLNKEQLDQLRKRFDATWEKRAEIENKYPSPDAAQADVTEGQTTTAEDVDGNESEVVENRVSKEEAKKRRSEAKPAPEGDELAAQGEQLSLFDETQMEDQETEAEQVQETEEAEAPVTEEQTAPVEAEAEAETEAEAEAEADAEAEAETEAEPVAEETQQDDPFEGGIDVSDGLDLSDTETVGDEEGQVSIEIANTLNKLLKGFASVLPKAGTKIKVYSRAQFDRISEFRATPEQREQIVEIRAQSGKGPVLGFYDARRNEIILPNDARPADVREEFAHAMFLPLANGKANPEAQKKLYDELMALKDKLNNKKFTAFMDAREAAYKKFGVGETKMREEMIVGFLNYYKNNPGTFKTVGGRIRQIINSAFKAIGQKGPLVLKTDADLMSLAEAFVAASEGREVQLDVSKETFEKGREKEAPKKKAKPEAEQKIDPEELKQKPTESDKEFRARMAEIANRLSPEETSAEQQAFEEGMEGLTPSLRENRKKFTYLQDTEVFYTEHPFVTLEQPYPVAGGRYTSPSQQKSIKVKDYFHFRNWFNKNTGNQEVNRITDMFFIKDGKVYKVKKPKPKVDKDGNKIQMEIPLTPRGMKLRRDAQRREKDSEQRRQAAEIARQGDAIFKRLPWAVYAHQTMFQPALPEGVPSHMLSGEMRVEFQKIYRDNLVAAERLNLSRDEFADIVSKSLGEEGKPPSPIAPWRTFSRKINPENHRDIFQATGRTMPGKLGEESAPGYTITYALDTDMIAAKRGSVARRDFSDPKLADRPRGTIDDLIGKVMAIGGFDRTWSTTENQIQSGTNSLEQVINEDGIVSNVITSVIDRATARYLVNFYYKQAQLDYERAVAKDPSLKGKPYTGTLAYGFSVLSPDATFGNPDVFRKVMLDVLDHIRKSENPSEEFKNFIGSLTSKAQANVYRLLTTANSARHPDGSYVNVTKRPRLNLAVNALQGKKITDLTLDNIKDIEQAIYMISDSKNHKALYDKGGDSEKIRLSFDLRKEFLNKKSFLDYYIREVNGINMPAANIDVMRDSFFEKTKFNDPMFNNRPDGVLDAYRTFEYRVNEKGEVEPFLQAVVDESKGFEGVITSTLPVSEVKYMTELYRLDDLDPTMEVKVGKEKKRIYFTKKDGTRGYKTVDADVRGPITKIKKYNKKTGEYEPITDEAEAREAALKKVLSLNQYSNVILGAGPSDPRRSSDAFQGIPAPTPAENNITTKQTGDSDFSEGLTAALDDGLFEAETAQGAFEMKKLTAYQKWKNLWIRRLVDKYNDIFDIQRAIEEKTGRLSKEKDFQMKEELMYGKAAEDLKRLDGKIDDIKKALKDRGVSVSELNDYLYALHVKERNAVIRERIAETNEKRKEQKKKLIPTNDAGSGKTDQWADETLARFSGAKKADMEAVAKMAREIQNDTRKTYVDFGLEKQEVIDAWEKMFENYVPLAGIAIDEESGATSSYPTGGAGLSVFGPMTKRAEGRKSEAENILAQIIAQNAAAHVKARTNEAVSALYKLAEDNPNPQVWQVMDEASSIDPHVVSVRIDGEQKFIRFKDASYAETLRNMNLPETNLFLRILRAPSNWLRRSFTTLNPEFVVSNFARDIQTAVFNAAAEAEIEGGILNGEKVMGDLIKTVPSALKHLAGRQIGRGDNDLIDRYYEDFKADGGKTGWAYAKRLNDIVAELEDSASETTRTQEILGVGKNVVEFVEGMNEAFEDSVRLASYIAARQNGVSREKAAQLAKNITVNFNKHGEWGQALNGVYLFFNASVQGTARMFRTVGTLKPPTRPDGSSREWHERVNSAQKMAAGLTLFSAMMAMMNAALSEEDEDEVLFYDKIPDYVKERNLIIMNPRDGKTYYKIPLPYGFNIFSNVGTVAADVARGGMDVDKGMMFLGSGLVNAFSPISFGQSESLGRSIAKGGIPTVAKPFFDAWGFNETYFGGPVAAEQLPFGVKRPESSMSFRSPEAVKSFFSWINEATGGSDRVSGAIDMNPDRMWYVFEYFIGGAGNFVNRTGKTIRSVGGKFKDSDYDIAVNDIPFARIMYGEQSRYYDHGKYRDNETKVKQLFLERKDSKDWSNPRYKGIVELNNKLKIAEKKLKKLREKRREARKIKDFTQRAIAVQKIMDEERRIIMKFNKRYNELRKD